jgi:membrane-associated protein
VNPFDAHDIVSTLGTVGVLAALFVETGLLVGLFLPGDSLLFLAGVASSGTAYELFGEQLSFSFLLLTAPLAATLGSQTGHWLGMKYGRPIFNRPESRFFNQSKVIQTEKWLERYGLGKALILSHFVPFVRTILNPLCGVIGISSKRFFLWNLVGSYIWTVGLISVGYLLGEKLKGSVDRYILPIVLVIIVLSMLPIIKEVFLSRRKHRE